MDMGLIIKKAKITSIFYHLFTFDKIRSDGKDPYYFSGVIHVRWWFPDFWTVLHLLKIHVENGDMFLSSVF